MKRILAFAVLALLVSVPAFPQGGGGVVGGHGAPVLSAGGTEGHGMPMVSGGGGSTVHGILNA